MFDFSKRARAWAMAWLFISLMLLTLAGCGGDVNDGGSTSPPASTKAAVGAEGGTVNGPDGVQVVIPAGALDTPTEIGISNDGSGASEIGGIKPISKVIAVTPHGTEFAESVRISLPFNPADVAAGTKPVIIKSQPGGTWTALASEVVGSTVSADISDFSYYAVGTCYTSRDVLVPGPDPLIACPAAHSLKFELLDGAGVALPVSRNSNGAAIPVLTLTEPAQLKLGFIYFRPPSGRLDHIFAVASGAVTPSDWPRDKPLGGPSDTSRLAGYQAVLTFDANPNTVPNARRPGGTVVRFRASVTTQMDAFYFGCLCFKPASWTYEAEVPVRVIYTAPVTPPPPPVATYTVGGSINGLTSAGLVLRNNGANNLSLAANVTAFTFAAPVNAGSAYSVSVLTQPAGQTCTVQNGSGTANANVANVAVSCVGASAPTATGPLSSMGGHTCAVKGDFTVACWGNNSNYALGDGTAVNRTFPVAVTGLTGVESVSVGTTHSCALKSDKTVWCWGANDFGQIGLNAAGGFPAPMQVAGLSGVAALSAGRTHNCVLKTDGTVACWGRNHLGQLGDGTTTDSFAPVVVSGLSGVSMLNGGWDRTCAVTAGGGVVCWGDLNYSLVGGLPVATVTPQTVAGLTSAVSVSSGGNFHACALKSDSTVACWGNNGDGALGNGTNVGGLTAVTVSGLTDAAKVSTASGHTCAIRTNGSVMCWGNNSRGQLGDNTTVPKNVPVSVVGLTSATAIATGAAFSCVLKTDGSAACWGYNLEGYLGDLSTVEKHVPSAVFGGAVFWK